MDERNDLIAILRARQIAGGETDAEFAARLRVDRETWRKLRTRQMKPGHRSIPAILRTYPDLRDVAARYLARSQ